MTKNTFTPKIIMLFTLFASSCPLAQVSVTVDDIVYNLLGEPYQQDLGAPWGEHEGFLHGVPDFWDWYWGARPGAWMDRGDNQAVNLWAQAYEWKQESPVTNIRIQVRNMMFYALVDGKWRVLGEGKSSGQMEGSNWKENFSGSAHLSKVRSEADNGGGMSFDMVAGYNFHWWVKNWPRAKIPGGVVAFYSVAEMRLIPNTDPDVDLSKAKYLASIGNDYYTTTTSAGPGPWPSLAIARHKFITPEWQPFTVYITGDPPVDEYEYTDLVLSLPLPPGVTASRIGPAGPSLPGKSELYPNYPNPFNPVTRIRFSLPRQSRISLNVYDVRGHKVRSLLQNRTTSSGSHTIGFNGKNLPSGIYLCVLQTGSIRLTQKMLLVK